MFFQTEPERTSYPSNVGETRCVYEQERLDFVAATTTTKFETNGYSHQCLGQLYDQTLVATSTHASTASHTRTTTTLKCDTRKVGSVTVSPRATHATEKCIVGRRDTTTATVTTILLEISGFSNRTCQSIDADGPSTHHIRPSWHPRNYSLVLVRTFEKAMRIMPQPQLPMSQLPSQNPQRPRVVSTHSSTQVPFAPLPDHLSTSLLCSRKV